MYSLVFQLTQDRAFDTPAILVYITHRVLFAPI